MKRLAILPFIYIAACGVVPPPPPPPTPPPVTATISLTLSAPESQIGELERVTAQVLDYRSHPIADLPVIFEVSGANYADGSATTDADGNAFFDYAGEEPGPDMVVAFADLNRDGQWQDDEPQAEAQKVWVEGPDEPFGIGDNETVVSQCGTPSGPITSMGLGSSGPRPEGWLIVGEEATLEATLSSSAGPTGGTIIWTLYDHLGGRLKVDGCSAIYRSPDSFGSAYQSSASISIRPEIETPPSPQGGGEGGPRNAGPSATARILIYDPANGPASLCGNEYLAVSASGPYSYSQNNFWYAGPATGGQFAGPFVNRGTFQPVAPGRYIVRVQWEVDGVQRDYPVNVPECSWGKVALSR